MDIGLEVLHKSFETIHDTKNIITLPYAIAGKQHNLRVQIDFLVVTKLGWPAGAFSGFNKFIANSDKLLEEGFKKHVKELGDYMDPKFCQYNHDPDPTYENFKKMVKFTTLIFSRAWDRSKHGQVGIEFAGICGEYPWDPEHGIGIAINNAGHVVAMSNFMDIYEYCY